MYKTTLLRRSILLQLDSEYVLAGRTTGILEATKGGTKGKSTPDLALLLNLRIIDSVQSNER